MIAAVFLLLHLPFLPASLEDLDSINFALGVRRFDVAAHQPHPPGYPVYVLAAKGLHAVVGPEARALGVLSVISGALAVFALAALYRGIEQHAVSKMGAAVERPPSSSIDWPVLTAVMAATAPLFWFTAARPLSDMAGLAASIGIQAMALTATGGTLALAALLAGVASGIRSQVIWLTLPVLLLAVVRLPRRERMEDARLAGAALVLGILIWFVPLVWLSGGPRGYWAALSNQGAEDLTGVGMLWTTHTVRQAILAFTSTFVAPFGGPILAAIALTLAAAGAVRLLLRSPWVLGLLVVLFGPYLVFDLLFQESVTTRYALPMVVPLAYLAVCGARWLRERAAAVVVVALSVGGLVLGVINVQAYAKEPAPAFRMLADMRAAAPTLGAPPVFATHRRESLDLRRPIDWIGPEMLSFSQRSAAPPKHEWLELVKYWNDGGRAPVWFAADPLRSDLALFDHGRPRSYRWPILSPLLLGGVRPNEMDWYVMTDPAWYLGEGWAVTPETAGVAKEDGHSPSIAPIKGWIHRRTEPVTVLIGGRNLAAAPASLKWSLDGRKIAERSVEPGFFMDLTTVDPSQLAGSGDYAALTVEATGDIAIEQFDAQAPDRVVFGYGSGWHEMEYNPLQGRVWRWMSERGELRVRGTGQALVITIDGVTETFSKPSSVIVRVGDKQIAAQSIGDSFTIRAEIPAALATGEQTIVIETDQVYIPAERSSRTADRRHLGLKIFNCRIEPAPG